MDEYCAESLEIEELMSKILRLKNLNNNSQETNCRELNGCHAMKPCDVQIEHQKYIKDYDGIEEVVGEDNGTENVIMATGRRERELNIPADHSNNSSTSNSTDNLSITDEIILLPNQQFSDDEISINSDDCVYAYRGADFDVVEYRNNNLDDETDFLEMDFEPDPASEIDNTNECRSLTFDHDPSLDEIVLSSLQPHVHDEPTFNNLSTLPPNHLQIAEEISPVARNHIDISEEDECEHSRLTGAKPKRPFEKPAGKIQSQKISKSDEKVGIVLDASFFAAGDDGVRSDFDEPCIDCLESEFLLTTIGRKMDTSNCRKCRRPLNHVASKTHDTTLFPLGFTFDDTRDLQKQNSNEQKQTNAERLAPMQHAENLLERAGKESVTFSSVNVDEKVITQALDHINVNFNKDIIKKHFDDLNTTKPHFDDVTALIVHNSKKNCDYKKIIKLIKLACKGDEVDIKFTQDENISKATEIVQVRSLDILQIWTMQPDLERLKKLNKKFLQMNVLGKIINLIRHAQQRNTKSEGEFIVIPQYYTTGYICITKK